MTRDELITMLLSAEAATDLPVEVYDHTFDRRLSIETVSVETGVVVIVTKEL